VILIWLFVVGAAIRHYFNRRHAGRTLWWIPVGCAAAIAGLAVWIEPASSPASAGSATVTFAQIQPIVQERCTYCHSAHPRSPQFTSAPMGITFDTPQQIAAQASLIEALAVRSHTMPLGNATRMTERERRLLGAWITQGAEIP
jgi:uncharacterized membrane protein